MTLTLAMMVKNEKRNLWRALRGTRKHVDEIVIVDTGSTDGTQKIAKKAADVFAQREWPGSFAEARNWTMDLATSDFILILDADEYVKGGWRQIRAALRDDVCAVELPVHNVIGQSVDRMWQLRVFRNDDEIRYSGQIHHQIASSVRDYMERTGRRAVRAKTTIIHTGYDLPLDELEAKYRPRIPMLVDAVNTHDGEAGAYYTYQLATMLYMLKDYERVLMELDTDLSVLKTGQFLHACFVGCQSAIALDRSEEAQEYVDMALSAAPDDPQALMLASRLAMERGDEIEGTELLCRAYLDRDNGRFVVNEEVIRRALQAVLKEAEMDEVVLDLERATQQRRNRIVSVLRDQMVEAA